jgi:predicted DNA-binding protein with PD1-like motif
MQYQEGSIGRVFALRLEEGDRLPDTLESFAREQHLAAAMVIYVGGAKGGSRLVVGPDASRPDAIVPLVHSLTGIQEVLAVGTLFPDDQGEPVLHMHAATGREGEATVGCSRAGVEVWLVGEVIILEILGINGRRRPEPPSGFSLLQFGEG